MKKISFFIPLLLFSGGVGAARNDAPMNVSYWTSTGPATKDIIILSPQCVHQWESSRWYLVNQVATKKVEVCSKCGLIRIDPKDLKK